MLTDETDIKIELRRFLRGISDNASSVVVFVEIDEEFELASGSTKKYIADLAKEAQFTVAAEGNTRIELKCPSIEPPTFFTMARAK